MLVDTKSSTGGPAADSDSREGFATGCDGKLQYYHLAASSYSLYSDYFWYEIGDMICIGEQALYYCSPRTVGILSPRQDLAGRGPL